MNPPFAGIAFNNIVFVRNTIKSFAFVTVEILGVTHNKGEGGGIWEMISYNLDKSKVGRIQ